MKNLVALLLIIAATSTAVSAGAYTTKVRPDNYNVSQSTGPGSSGSMMHNPSDTMNMEMMDDADITVQLTNAVTSQDADRVRASFESEDAIERVVVSPNSSQIQLQLKDNSDFSDTDIRNTLRDSGYSVKSIDR